MSVTIAEKRLPLLRGDKRLEEPFIVVGTGRCGTSTVARVLQERMGVNFCTPPGIAHYAPDGLYEAHDIRNLVAAAAGEPWFAYELDEIVDSRRPKPWGMKTPRLSYVLPRLSLRFQMQRVIICERDLEKVIDSIERHGLAPKGRARRYATEARDLIEAWCKTAKYSYVRVSIDENPSDEGLESSLREAFAWYRR